MGKTPLETIKERFNDKAGLVQALRSLISDELWTDRLNTDKGLDSVSNKKLLRLHEVLTSVKSQFGSRGKLLDAILTGEKRSKDGDYKKGLERLSTPQLFQIFLAGQKRAKRAAS
jgi:hypothetical protein